MKLLDRPPLTTAYTSTTSHTLTPSVLPILPATSPDINSPISDNNTFRVLRICKVCWTAAFAAEVARYCCRGHRVVVGIAADVVLGGGLESELCVLVLLHLAKFKYLGS